MQVIVRKGPLSPLAIVPTPMKASRGCVADDILLDCIRLPNFEGLWNRGDGLRKQRDGIKKHERSRPGAQIDCVD